jgi:pimeloyl-ACP methyl ester carboxylesterase
MMSLICLHGIGMHGGTFARQIVGLAPRRVVGLDLPGYGGTPLDGAMTFAGLARHVASVVDAEAGTGGGAKVGTDSGDGEGPGGGVHLLGHSMGGMVALELAATRPEGLASLILCNTTPAFGGRDDSFRREFVGARLGPLDAGQSMAQIAPAQARAVCGPQASAEDIAFVAGLMAETPEQTYRAAIECLVTFDRREALERLALPVLVIGAEQDTAAPARSMEKMAARIPGAELHILRGGHMTPVEQVDAVNALLRDFLARVEAG